MSFSFKIFFIYVPCDNARLKLLFGTFISMLYLCLITNNKQLKLLELEVRTYIGKEYKDYLRSQQEDLPEGDEWKAEVEDYKVEVPKAYPSRILINTSKFLSAIETYSIEEMANNPEHPTYDSVDVCLEDGLQISVVGTLDEFIEKWEEHHKIN